MINRRKNPMFLSACVCDFQSTVPTVIYKTTEPDGKKLLYEVMRPIKIHLNRGIYKFIL